MIPIVSLATRQTFIEYLLVPTLVAVTSIQLVQAVTVLKLKVFVFILSKHLCLPPVPSLFLVLPPPFRRLLMLAYLAFEVGDK